MRARVFAALRTRAAVVLTVCTLLILALSTSLAAQLYVHVTSQGVAVPGAEVLAWGDKQLLGKAVTDGDGRARLSIAPHGADYAGFLTIRRLGFVAVRVPLSTKITSPAETLSIELPQVPVALAVLTVRENRLRCPEESETAAEGLWRSAASRYTAGQAQLYFGYDKVLSDDEFVAPEARGFGDAMSRRAHVVVAPDDRMRTLLASPPPYAAYERHVNVLGEYWKWRYAPLHQSAAGHFAADAFRERHVFAILDSAAGSTTIGFCPKGRDETTIKGELVIGPDTLFKSGKWSYSVSHDGGGEAGAEAVFGTSTFEGATFLVAVQGAIWRREGRDHFRQDRFALSQWKFGRTSMAATADAPSRPQD